jgi:enoyl-CoA hydratase/carnithine racemase
VRVDERQLQHQQRGGAFPGPERQHVVDGGELACEALVVERDALRPTCRAGREQDYAESALTAAAPGPGGGEGRPAGVSPAVCPAPVRSSGMPPREAARCGAAGRRRRPPRRAPTTAAISAASPDTGRTTVIPGHRQALESRAASASAADASWAKVRVAVVPDQRGASTWAVYATAMRQSSRAGVTCCTVRIPSIPGSDMADIAVEDRGPVRLGVIDNQPTRNAFTSGWRWTFRRRPDEAEADPAVRCVVVTGAGNLAFSSGHDLSDVLARPENASDPVKNAAFILALSCDLRIASHNAASGASGARIGLLPVGGQLSRLVDLASYPVASKLTATAAPMPAEGAYQVGLANRLTEPVHALDAALKVDRVIAGNSPAVVHSVKAGLRRSLSEGLGQGCAASRSRRRCWGPCRTAPRGSRRSWVAGRRSTRTPRSTCPACRAGRS